MKFACKLALAAVFVVALPSSARPAYVGTLPNVTSCGACHASPSGGGPRNDFGQDVEASMPFSGPNDATWTALFCVDSDGDGKTNGQELGDPCGAWKNGDSNPDLTETNPGDDSDTTDVEGECDGAAPDSCDLVAPSGCASTSSPLAFPGFGLLSVALLAVRRRR